jgi:hypothetical protein
VVEDPLFLFIGEVFEMDFVADPIGVGTGEGGFAGGIDEEAADVVEEVVAAGAGDGPVGAEGFVGGEDFFDDDVEGLVFFGESFAGDGGRPGGAGGRPWDRRGRRDGRRAGR